MDSVCHCFKTQDPVLAQVNSVKFFWPSDPSSTYLHNKREIETCCVRVCRAGLEATCGEARRQEAGFRSIYFASCQKLSRVHLQVSVQILLSLRWVKFNLGCMYAVLKYHRSSAISHSESISVAKLNKL